MLGSDDSNMAWTQTERLQVQRLGSDHAQLRGNENLPFEDAWGDTGSNVHRDDVMGGATASTRLHCALAETRSRRLVVALHC